MRLFFYPGASETASVYADAVSVFREQFKKEVTLLETAYHSPKENAGEKVQAPSQSLHGLRRCLHVGRHESAGICRHDLGKSQRDHAGRVFPDPCHFHHSRYRHSVCGSVDDEFLPFRPHRR